MCSCGMARFIPANELLQALFANLGHQWPNRATILALVRLRSV